VLEVVLEVVKSRIEKIVLDGYGSYLGRNKGCFIIRDAKGDVQRYSHYQKEIGEAILKEGKYVSVDALRDLLLWNMDTYIMTQKNVATGIL